jgi:Ca-activated chloride channel family protein
MAVTPLTLSCMLAATTAPVTGQRRLVYLLVEVTGGEGAGSLPGNLGFILDASDSMRIRLVTDEQFVELAKNGLAQEVMTDGVPAYQIRSVPPEMIARFPRRIDYVSEALHVASEFLRPVDYYSVVAFAGQAHTMIPATPGKDRRRLNQAAGELEYMKLGDETNMAEGIAMALKEVKLKTDKKYATRLILLTDGHTRNVKECYELAREARKAGIKLTTMGIGVEFNEDLLIPLADQTGGNAYYIQTPNQLPDAFRNELGAATRISYRNVEVKVQQAEGVELRKVHRVLPELSTFDHGANMNGSYALILGDHDPAVPQALLLEFVIPPWSAGSHRIGQFLLVWDDPEGGMVRKSKRQEVNILLSSKATAPLNDRVMNIIEKVGAFKMGTKALEVAQNAAKTADQEGKNSATVRLRQAATRLLNMGEDSMANTMLQQAENMERSGKVDPEVTKRLRYETRRMTQKP